MASAGTQIVRVLGAPKQELFVRMRSERIPLFEGNFGQRPLPEGWENLEEGLLDPVKLFARCVNLGMFCGTEHEPTASQAIVLETHADLDRAEQTWRLSVEGVELGALRLLWELISSRTPDEVELRTVSEAAMAEVLEVGGLKTLPYPKRPEALEFEVDDSEWYYRGETLVQIVFAGKVPEAELKEACEALELWGCVLMGGGYPDPYWWPSSPPLPYSVQVVDDRTVDTTFVEKFHAADECFHAVVNLTRRLHQRGCLVERLVIC